jgi:type VI secretion system protein ImpC
MMEVEVATRRTKTVAPAEEPARYLVLGDFGGRRTDLVSVDRDNLSDALSILRVNAGGMPIRELEDFHPDRLFQRLEMAPDDDVPERAPSPESPRADIVELLRPRSLLEQIAEGGDPFEQYVKELARAHSVPQKKSVDRTAALSDRMNSLLHHPRFQALESAWRGIDFAVRQMDDAAARIHVAQYSKEDLAIDLASDNLRATRLYTILHSRRWTAAIGLHSFDEANIELLARIALVAADAQVPYIAESSPGIAASVDLLREIPESSHLGLALPRLLLRLPYGQRTSAIDSFKFEEMPGAPVHGHYLWGNAAIACLAVLVRGDAENLNLDDLPAHTYKQDSEWAMTPCAEISLTETQVLALIDRGLMPLISYKDRPLVRLAGFRAVNSAPLPLSVPF